MSNDSNVYLDANESLDEVAALVLSLLQTDIEAIASDDPLDFVRRFWASAYRCNICIAENTGRHLYQLPMSRYRYWIGLSRGSDQELAGKLFEALKEADIGPVLYEYAYGDISEVHCPTAYVPNYPVVNYAAPIEIWFGTNLKERDFRRELNRLHNLDLNKTALDFGVFTFDDLGVRFSLGKIAQARRKYRDMNVSYVACIMGIGVGFDDGREHRDAFAAALYAELRRSNLYEVSIFEVKDEQRMPFDSTPFSAKDVFA